MADLSQSLIQIKRSKTNAHPGKLRPGELAFSSNESGANANGLGILYIGGANPGADGYANTCHVIGGSHYTNLLDVTAGKLTAGKAIVAGANGEIDHLAVGALNGVEEGGKKVLHLGTDGETVTVIQDPYVKGAGENGADVPLATFIDTLIESGVELVAGNGIESITKNADGAFQIGLKKIHDFSSKEGNVETVGSSTAIPVITINEYGQVTAATTTAISTKLAVDGSEVDLVEGKLATADGVKSTQTSEGVVTVSVDDTVIRTTGGQTIAGTLNVTGQADFGVAPTVGEEVVLTDATVGDNLIYKSDVGTTDKVGGIEAGRTFTDGITVLDLIDELLHPYMPYGNVSASITKQPTSNILEMGNSVTFSAATGTWASNGTKVMQSVKLMSAANGGGSVIATNEGPFTSTSKSAALTFDAQTFTSNVQWSIVFSDGKTTKTANGPSVTFVYPYYTGVVGANAEITADEITTLTKEVIAESTNKAVKYTTSNQRAVFAYPSKYGALKEIKDPNNLDATNTFTRSEINIVCNDGTSVSYYVYVSGASTVTNYQYTFKQ